MIYGCLRNGGLMLLLSSVATSAFAQVSTGRQFTVTPSAGIMYWDEASALAVKKPGSDGRFTETLYNPTVGLTADYSIASPFSVGLYVHAARPTTRGDYFPAVLFDYGSRSEVYSVSQRVTTLMYGLQGSVNLEIGRMAPFLSIGGGATRLTLDPQQNDGNTVFTNSHIQFGGGLGFRLGDRTALKADVRDMVFLNWDRDRLNPVNSNFQNTRLPAVNTAPPAEKSTVHNWRFALGLSFVPQRTSEGGTP